MADQQAIYITPEVISFNPASGLVNRGNAQVQRQSQNFLPSPTTVSSNLNNTKKFIGPPVRVDVNDNRIGQDADIPPPPAVVPKRTIGIPSYALICFLLVLAVLLIIGGIVFLFFIHRITVVNLNGK
jgi:hypothetical protein